MSQLSTITETLISGDGEALQKLVQEALDAGIPANTILNDALISGMDIVGAKMECGDMFIPEVLMAAQAMSESVEILKPLLADGQSSVVGKVIIGTVKGDLHDIGKNLVKMMLESAGFEIIDLGVDISPEDFVKAIIDNKPDIVGLSALLTTTMPMMKKSIQTIEESGLRKNLKIIVGGAPVNQAFADEIGADGYAPDAGAASKLAKSLLQQ
ncbi:MAG: cobalamin-binding protein [Desulfobulbaceae bacterium]|nr:MAG: cobalamin-binding protein [Desulfobulbaceae bacterium]